MKKLGSAVSPGVGIGKILLVDNSPVIVKDTYISNHQKEKEFQLFEEAVSKTIAQIEKIKTISKDKLSAETIEIFDAHLMIANDSDIKSKVQNLIEHNSYSASSALNKVANDYIDMFNQMDDAYFKERALDIKDVTQRVLKNLLNLPIIDFQSIDTPTIIAIDDLTPSDISQINLDYIKGVVTKVGGATSHTAIIAKLLGLPMVSNIDVETLSNEEAILDGVKGEIILNPDEETMNTYIKIQEKLLQDQKDILTWIGKKSATADGTQIHLLANIGTPSDITYVEKYDAEGVGLMRTEFLYLDNSDFPTEEEQFNAYKTVLESQKGKPVIIRTIDIGGDKVLPYLPLEHEDNPFLGVRAIRLAFKHLELFKTQIRALLRASVYGDLRIMFPMIAIKSEFLKAKEIVEEIKNELKNNNIDYNSNIELGIMIEIPSSALMADDLAQVVDFFSIGTNDLIQYTMASDRLNQNLSYLYQPLNPAILKLISMVTTAAKKHNIWVGVCGEMASDPTCAPFLVGLGVDELSMSPSNILKIRRELSKYNMQELKDLANKALSLDSDIAIKALLNNN